MCKRFVILASVFVMEATALGQSGSGPLPRGELKPAAVPTPVAPATDPAAMLADCFTYLGTPMLGDQFLNDAGELFVLVDEAAAKGADAASSLRKRTVTRVRLSSGKTQPLLSVSTQHPGALLPHGVGPVGMSVVTFHQGETGCYQGPATAVSVSLTNKAGAAASSPGATKSVDDARLGIVTASTGRVLADLSQGRILEVDPQTLQRRGLFDFGQQVVPLYFDIAGRKLFALRTEKGGWVLEHLMLGRTTPLQSLTLAGGEKLLRQDGYFGVLGLDQSKRGLRIRELVEWSGVKQTRDYSVTLPEGYDVSRVAVLPHFPSKQALVMGNTLLQRRTQRKALLVNYQRGKILTEFIPPKGAYFRSVSFSSDGREVFITIMDEMTQKHREIRVYHIKRKTVRTIVL